MPGIESKGMDSSRPGTRGLCRVEPHNKLKRERWRASFGPGRRKNRNGRNAIARSLCPNLDR